MPVLTFFFFLLQGGEEGEYSLTAYIVAALLEAGHSVQVGS